MGEGVKICLKPTWPSVMRDDLCRSLVLSLSKPRQHHLQALGQSVLLRAEEFPFKISLQVIKTDSIEICS